MTTLSKKFLPNFIVIGAQRCATSWLYFCLKEHPDVYLPYIKEVSFFSDYFENGMDWYERYFEHVKAERAIGEITPAYLYREPAAARIAKTLPQAKLIVIFRNPVERAFSQYQKHVRAGIAAKTFEEGIETDPEYTERGLYYQQLSRFLKFFPREQILVLIYEDLKKDPVSYFRKVLQFVGADASIIPDKVSQVIPSDDLNSGLYKNVSKTTVFMREKLKLGFLVDAVKRSPLRKTLDSVIYRFGPKAKNEKRASVSAVETVNPDTRKKLNQFFAEDISKLEAFLGRDLTFWRTDER